MTSSYFHTRKWVFDAAALRRQRKATDLIAGMHDHVSATATIENGIDIDPDSWAALQVLERAQEQVSLEFARVNAAAKRVWERA